MVTRFDTREFLDIGGFVNIRLRMDDDKMNGYMYQVGFESKNIDTVSYILYLIECSHHNVNTKFILNDFVVSLRYRGGL